jgi:hypothetical protein
MEDVSDLEFWSDAGLFSANDRRRMLDVEFISELAVAVLNGLQNKKKQLEEFYQQYETSFEDAERLRSLFVQVLGEIGQILPNIAKTRWRKKSDFYTLFVTLGQYSDHLPLSAEKRQVASRALTNLGSAVDEAIRKESDTGGTISPEVADYLRYVERAASDLGSRRERERVLKQVLADVF